MTGLIGAKHRRPMADRHTTRNLARVRPVIVPPTETPMSSVQVGAPPEIS